MNLLRSLYNDERGFIVSSELILIATILVIGLVAGLNAVRVAVVTELADVGDAIGSLNQSYSFGGALGHHAKSPGSRFHDEPDSCDRNVKFCDHDNSRCLRVCRGARPECGRRANAD